MATCETCRFWKRGSAYTIEGYGNTPKRLAWSAAGPRTGYDQQEGLCCIVAPYRSNGEFPQTYEFLGCGEHQPKEKDNG